MLRCEIKEFLLDMGNGEAYSAAVPFTLYSVMSDNGIKKNLSDKCDITKMRASATFSVDEELYSAKYTYIRICGNHSPFEIFLNGVLLGRADYGCERLLVDLGSGIKKGENTLTFEFSNPDFDTGIFAALELLRFNNSIIDGVLVNEVREGDSVSLNVEITTLGNTERTRGVATLISSAGQIYYGGFSDGLATIRISDPLFWSPLGHGVQNLYKLTVNLYGDAEAEDTLEFRIGLRQVSAGSGALLSVNGLSFLPMGAVYVPEKIYLPEQSAKRTAAFVTSAAMAGFNTLVIRGNRLPSDAFFDLCDVHGIAVIFEVSDKSDSILKSIAALSTHPSIVHVDVIGENAAKTKEMIRNVDISLKNSAENYFGEESIPSDRVTYSRIAPEDRNVFSEEMEKQSGGACINMAAKTAEKYLYAWSFSDFAYLTRLAQAENVKREMLSRREALGKAGRAVFSEISSERLISSSSLDTEAGWKAVQYYAKDFFAPVTVTAKANGNAVGFTAINNKNVAVFGTLCYCVKDNENNTLYNYSEDIEMSENSSRVLFTHDLSEYVSSHENERFIEYSFTEGNITLAEGVELFVLPKRFKYKNPEIKAEISGENHRFSLTLTAKAYAGKAEVSFENTDAVFFKNYFDITSEVPVKVTFTASSPVETAKTLTKQLKIRSLYDIGKN